MSDVTIGPDATVTVLGRSRLEVAPDFATVAFVARVDHARRQHAIDRTTVKADTARRLLADETRLRRVEFSGLAIAPMDDRDRPSFRAWIHGSFEAVDPSTIAKVVQRLVDQADNDVLAIRWGLDDAHPARKQVRADAVVQAIDLARTHAEAAGGALGPLLHLRDPALPAFGQVTAPDPSAPADQTIPEEGVPLPSPAAGGPALTVDPEAQVLRAAVEARFQIVPA